MMKRLVIAAVLSAASLTALGEQTRERVGRAYDRDTGELLYEERHREVLQGSRVLEARVLYADPEGRVFGEKRVDFTLEPGLPSFELVDRRSGHLEALDRPDGTPGLVEVRFRRSATAPERSERLPPPEGALADAGFDRFIESNWPGLVAGERYVRSFLVPSTQSFIDFAIERAGGPSDDTLRLTMKVDSFLLRLVAPEIRVEYDRGTRRLLRYEGVSNLRGPEGDPFAVRIEFEYPDAARLAGSEGTSTARSSDPG